MQPEDQPENCGEDAPDLEHAASMPLSVLDTGEIFLEPSGMSDTTPTTPNRVSPFQMRSRSWAGSTEPAHATKKDTLKDCPATRKLVTAIQRNITSSTSKTIQHFETVASTMANARNLPIEGNLNVITFFLVSFPKVRLFKSETLELWGYVKNSKNIYVYDKVITAYEEATASGKVHIHLHTRANSLGWLLTPDIRRLSRRNWRSFSSS
jgi:hypothetical protein